MSVIRVSGYRGFAEEMMQPGDCMLVPEVFSANATVGATTLAAASLITGELYRSGSTAAYTDTFDTASAILNAMAGNDNGATVIPGLSFKLRLINSVAFAETITLGAGMVSGLGSIGSVAASSWRDFLFSFTSVQQPVSNIAATTNGSATVYWVLSPGQNAEIQGPSPLAINIMPGATVIGTGIPAGATVIGLIEGQGGTLGFTMSANATATNAVVSVSFGPTITVSSSGSGSL